MERKTDKRKLPRRDGGGEMKRIAEEEPIIPVVEVADPIQVRLALRVVPPDITRLLVALKGLYEMSSVPPPLDKSRD